MVDLGWVNAKLSMLSTQIATFTTKWRVRRAVNAVVADGVVVVKGNIEGVEVWSNR